MSVADGTSYFRKSESFKEHYMLSSCPENDPKYALNCAVALNTRKKKCFSKKTNGVRDTETGIFEHFCDSV